MSDNGCSPRALVLNPGRVVFTISNPRSGSANTFEVRSDLRTEGKVTNVLGGISRELSVDLGLGTYTMHCTGGGEGGTGTVTVREPEA